MISTRNWNQRYSAGVRITSRDETTDPSAYWTAFASTKKKSMKIWSILKVENGLSLYENNEQTQMTQLIKDNPRYVAFSIPKVISTKTPIKHPAMPNTMFSLITAFIVSDYAHPDALPATL